MVAQTPMPVTESNVSTLGKVRFSLFAASTIALAIGCSERDSTAATMPRT